MGVLVGVVGIVGGGVGMGFLRLRFEGIFALAFRS